MLKFRRFVHMILSGNELLTITKGHNCVVNLREMTRNDPHLFNINAYAKWGLIPSIRSQDIERKRSSDDNQGP